MLLQHAHTWNRGDKKLNKSSLLDHNNCSDNNPLYVLIFIPQSARVAFFDEIRKWPALAQL